MLRTLRQFLGLGVYQREMSPRNVIFITGCDSGLGYALSVFCHSLNMTVVSGCHNLNSEGSNLLQALSHSQRMFTLELDLLQQSTIEQAHRYISELLQSDRSYQFTALVNNAGVMCMGEFEWQTHQQIETQINVNLLGTMRLTKQLLPLLREHRARIINVTSHCGLQALPALATYAASKAGLRIWNDALRMEMQQYGVKVVNFIPGSYVTSTNISARQQQHAKDMLNAFTTDQRQFYLAYFQQFNQYLEVISGFKKPGQLQDAALLAKFQDALTSSDPKPLYRHEPWRYTLYHMLFRICPTPIVDWLTVRFCAMPTYGQVTGTSRH